MTVVIAYFFQEQRWRKHLLAVLLCLIAYIPMVSSVFAQQYTQRDQAEIKYLAQLTVIEYESILNLISNAAISESVLKDAAQNSYNNPDTKIFYSPDINIEDDIAPSKLYAPEKSTKKVKDYIAAFDEMYVKSELETVDFYDFQISNLKSGEYPYIKVKYTAYFKGRHKKDPAPYKPVDRLAELRVVKKGERWVTYISAITSYDPASPIASAKEDVKLNNAVADDGTFAGKLDELKSMQFDQGQQVDDQLIAQSWRAFDDKRFAEIRLMGERAESSRNYAQARDLYEQALQVIPKEATLEARVAKLNKAIQQNELFEKKFNAGEYVEAIKAYSEAIAGDPKNPDLYYGRGKSYEKLNELQTAIKDFSTAIRLDNNFVDALSHRAQLYVRTSELQKAIVDYDQIISSLPNTSAYYPERARLKAKLGDYKGALEDYNAAIRLNPQVAALYYEKGMIQNELKQKEQAIESFSLAIEKDSQFADAYYARGLAYVDNQNISTAAVDFERARKAGLKKEQLAAIDKIASEYAAQGDKAMEKADYKQALENYIKVVLFSPEDESAWVKKGDAHLKLQDNENAIQSYSKAIELKKVSQAYYKRGLVYRQLNDMAAAKSDFKQFIPLGWQLISSAESKAGTAQSSLSLEQIAKEIAEAWYVLGNAQLMSEQYNDALASMDKALEINKSYPEALFVRGSAQLALKNYKKAIKDIEKSIKSGIADDPRVYLTLGDAYHALGQIDYAISIYTYIIDSVDKGFEQAYIRRAASYKEIKQFQLALQDIKLALSLNDDLSQDVGLITNKGLMELYESKFQDADHSFDQALSLENNSGWALYGKASVLASQNKLEESLDFFRKAFQTGEIQWSAIKDDPIIKHVSKQKAFKELVDASLRL